MALARPRRRTPFSRDNLARVSMLYASGRATSRAYRAAAGAPRARFTASYDALGGGFACAYDARRQLIAEHRSARVTAKSSSQ